MVPSILIRKQNKNSSFRGKILMLLLCTSVSFSFAGSSSMSYKEDYIETNNLGQQEDHFGTEGVILISSKLVQLFFNCVVTN